MRKNKKTIILAEIRRLIRRDVRRYNLRDESPDFWDSENYRISKKKRYPVHGDFPYYSKSRKAIESLAEEIYRVCKK